MQQYLTLFRFFLRMLVVAINLVWSFKAEFSDRLNIATIYENAKFGQRKQNHFLGKRGKYLNLQNFFAYIGAYYKIVFKSIKSLDWIFWATEYWFKVQNPKFSKWIQNHFSGNARQTLVLTKSFSLFCSLPLSFLSSVKNLVLILWVIEY